MTARWERMQQIIIDNGLANTTFGCDTLAFALGMENWEVSQLIQAHLDAQLRGDRTQFVIHRCEGRTRTALWRVGVRTADARNVAYMVGDDLQARVRRAAGPQLDVIGRHNPRARQVTDALGQFLDAGVAAMLAVGGEEDGQHP